MFKKKLLLAIIFIGFAFITSSTAQSVQNEKNKILKKTGWNTVAWSICHPLQVRKSLVITKRTLTICDSINKLNILSGLDHNQTDAFRHALWMALLSQEIGDKRAYKLGLAYENDNKRYFFKMKSKNNSGS